RRERRGRRAGWYGTNTDVEGFLAPLRSRAPQLLSRPGRAAVIGAGGAARSVLYALTTAGVPALVLNRTPERAAALAARFGCAWGGLDAPGLARLEEYGELIVQATGAGMGAQAGVDPLAGYRFRGNETLYELVYEPELTPVAARARKAGCTIIPGFQMLLAQARAQFRLHTGQEYPPGLYG
ncbi:MAG: 3-dehydroquinate dehydratase, partial [Spirochaetales bacterium]|nr:3-dehydroquinate dehydratase [Spirochaetales bacterium]